MAESLKELLVAGGAPIEVAEKIASLVLPAVRLSTRRLESDAEAPVGSTKLGGSPDLTPGFSWPSWRQRPLSFLGQVSFQDLAGFDFCSVLPPAGLLSFFYDDGQKAWGFDPNDRGSWLVHFEPELEAVRRAAVSERGNPPFTFPPCKVVLSQVLTLPAIDSRALADRQLSALELDIYGQVLDQIEAQMPAAVEHQLLGHAAPIQDDDMQLECQLVAHGLYCGDQTGYDDPRARELASGAGTWRLLAQIDSDDTADMMWGDCGRLFFWITADTLARRAFGESWMILQCS